MGSKLTALAAAAAATVLIWGIAPANAQTGAYTVIGTEDPVTGFTGDLFNNMFSDTYLVASDGESPFHPFNAPYDVSDGINLSGAAASWTQANDSSWNSLGNETWVLPAVIPGCGAENEPTCEPVGHFIVTDGASFVPNAIGTWVILDWTGDTDWIGQPGWSDYIVTYNDANGNANILFYSDFAAVPEPATWAMMLIGFAGLGLAGYRARKPSAALAV
jgi:hypothetical protein